MKQLTKAARDAEEGLLQAKRDSETALQTFYMEKLTRIGAERLELLITSSKTATSGELLLLSGLPPSIGFVSHSYHISNISRLVILLLLRTMTS